MPALASASVLVAFVVVLVAVVVTVFLAQQGIAGPGAMHRVVDHLVAGPVNSGDWPGRAVSDLISCERAVQGGDERADLLDDADRELRLSSVRTQRDRYSAGVRPGSPS